MVLADTSVWVDHLRRGNSRLAALLDQEAVLIHPFIVGELACGGIRNRKEILSLLQSLPALAVVPHAEAMRLVETRALFGRGLGWIDAHLLAAARLRECTLWSLDGALTTAAEELGLAVLS